MHLSVISVILLGGVVGIAYASYDEFWSYKDTITLDDKKKVYGPKDWGEAFNTCKGKAQSPINIDSKKTVKTKFGPLRLEFNAEDDFFAGSLKNNGRSPTFTSDKSKGNITITFDKKTFLFHQLQFHFGCVEKNGSEHTVDDKTFPLEMHMVFHNNRYKFEKATKEKDGLLIIAALFEMSKDPFYYWQKLDGLDGLLLPGMTAISVGYVRIGNPIVLLELPLKKLIPSLSYKDDKDAPAYYTYKGSLTTPNCHESVRWVVLKEPIQFSEYMLSLYRNLKTELANYTFDLLCGNFRPTQKLNDRKVEIFEPEK